MLRLPNDVPATAAFLDAHLSAHDNAPARIVAAIANAVVPLADRLAAGRLSGDPDAVVGINESGDRQKALDVAAHEHMLTALRSIGVARVLSEEADEIVELHPDGDWIVAIDPIDGSGSIGVGAPLGTLFSVMPAMPDGFLAKGRSIVAAGYASFGHSVDFGFSLGDGVSIATLDRTAGGFRLARRNVQLAPSTGSVAYNASNERHWPGPLRAYVRDLIAGKEGPRGREFNMRWLAAAVGELHRILLQGGVFLYPGDSRAGYEHGRLRLVYEAAPIAFLVEQAGGRATDGLAAILDRIPASLHEHTPLIFGAAEEVETIGRYLGAEQQRG
ncbi:class 1 fructose-bisphosphatase [Mesorhizobium sp. VK23B]|uniref:Fructose-1,6-bisphosphatase class 1 n=1 Tax=Mesorhizobium dulcispinae TaxID=3072316 RepID=A0ABU4X8C6_9HYPH|nr:MULTISPECIES: class 1 fructose-bisphosphatase [unclassified Mesorhizobium]MDX8464661.1 class 1 fructose-bisphosphatase [Mesorhizobium sp. VK23B]MDX8471047.1 class 1 fructose-bisphosphatase [Mesorhizobium sp. VK23A]